MNGHSKTLLSPSHLNAGMAGLAVLTLLGFNSVSRANVTIANNIPSSWTGESANTLYHAEGFSALSSGTVSSGAGSSSDGIGLELNFTSGASGTLSVYIYNATAGGAPSGAALDSGTISVAAAASGNNEYLVNLSSAFSFTSGQNYAVSANLGGFTGSGSVKWAYIEPKTTPNFLGAWDGNATGTTWGDGSSLTKERGLDIEAVPEVPFTGLAFGFGTLAIVGIQAFRRKSSTLPVQS